MAGSHELRWCLVSLAVGPRGRREFVLEPGANVVGRKREAAINLLHLDVSREQCVIFLIDDTVALIDSGSRNGTYVNGKKVVPQNSVTLFNDDTIGFGTHTCTVESSDSKTPFLVYRITKKIIAAVFDRLTIDRQLQHSTVKRTGDPSSEMPSKRLKADCETIEPVLPVPMPVQVSTEVSSTTQVSTTREGLVEFLVIDNSNESVPRMSQTHEDTRSITKSQTKLASVGSSTKETAMATSSQPFVPPICPQLFNAATSSTPDLIDSDDSKHSDIPTFSLISDDDEDDDFMSSQIFVKNEPQSFHTPEAMDTSVLDDEVIDVYDSDEESFFDDVLSQSLSQSILYENEEFKTSKNEKEVKKSSRSHKRHAKPRTESSKETATVSKRDRKIKMPERKKRESPNQVSSSEKPSSTSKLVSRKDVVEDGGKIRTMKHRMEAGSKPSGKDIADNLDGLPTNELKNKIPDPDALKSTASSENQVENIVRKIINDTRQKNTLKKMLLVEPHAMPTKKEAKSKVYPPAKVEVRTKRVTFKEQINEVKEFECQGNMKKISTMPTHLLKEHPAKVPALQWNSLLLRSCPEVSHICRWNLKWLEEFRKVSRDPPLYTFKPNPISNKFKEYSDYKNTMLALVMHELWSELCQIHLAQTETQRFNLFSGVIEYVKTNSFDPHTLFANCKITTSANASMYIPNLGDLVGVQILSPGPASSHMYDSFGVVVKQYSKVRLQKSRDTKFSSRNEQETNQVVCSIELLFRTSRTQSNVREGCALHLRVYKNLLNQIKYFLALKKLMSSPLQSVILDPSKAVKGTTHKGHGESKIPMSTGQIQLVDSNCGLNQLQKAAVDGIFNSIMSERKSISVIHGPPGTGKSSTITHLIRTLLPTLRKSTRKGSPPPKILLCAPSNTAIDELCLKLLEARRKMPEDEKFKLTRVGNLNMMHPQVVDIASVSLARRGLSSTPDPQSLQIEISLISARIQGLKNGLEGSKMKPSPDRELHMQKYRDIMEKHETRLTFYKKTLANINSGRPPTNPCEDWKLFYQEECAIIAGAEIIATTLCSSSSRKMSDAFSDSTQFSCCIIDEATQATEPEVLIPLHHDICHLVLVGDPQQLGPTVTSRFAREMHFDWSLYHRMMGEWKDTTMPLYPLREQYRMHSEIAAFPSAKFYNSELITPKCLQFALPFPPYYVISHSWLENSDKESNSKEAWFIIELIQKLRTLDDFKSMSVGVIVPYHAQRSLIGKALHERREKNPNDKTFNEVVVNTIDSFQGQQKDMIILSCVRTSRIGFLSDSQRLNVALTRAKRCLLVVGNFNALKSDDVWKDMLSDALKRRLLIDASPNDRIAAGIIFSKYFARGKHAKT